MALKDKLAKTPNKTNYEEELNQQIQQSPLFLELFDHTLTRIEQQRMNGEKLLKDNNEQLRRRIDELESQNKMFQAEIAKAIEALCAEVKESNIAQFKSYAKSLEGRHKKWQMEQHKLQSDIKRNLGVQKNIVFFGNGLYVLVVVILIMGMIYNSF